MAYLALYRKYRPEIFADVVGQKVIIQTIQNAIRNNKISHAYLFSGPRGTGKTSVAKIIGKTINCMNITNSEACGECISCQQINLKKNSDIIEIDAASNNGVDEIRELKNKINLIPTTSQYKIYIIDEVHMLSIGAFNALLKTLEEPPRHAIFILATTEIQKIPATIISRCQRFDFKKVNSKAIVKRLETITKKENILIKEDALEEIARLSDGGMRDAIGILDQVISYNPLQPSIGDVYEVAGAVSNKELFDILEQIENKNVRKLLEKINNLYSGGKNISNLINDLILLLRDLLIYKTIGTENYNEEKIKLLDKFHYITKQKLFYYFDELNKLSQEVKELGYSKIMFEVTMLKLMNFETIITYDKKEIIEQKNEDVFEKKQIVQNKLIHNNEKNPEDGCQQEKGEDKNLEELVVSSNLIQQRINNTLVGADKEELLMIKSKWNKIHSFVTNKNNSSLVGLLLDSEVIAASPTHIIICFQYDSCVTTVNNSLLEVEKIIKKLLGKSVSIIAVTKTEWEKEKKQYILNKKKGIIYKYIEEETVVNLSKKKTKKFFDPNINNLIDVYGEGLVEVK